MHVEKNQTKQMIQWKFYKTYDQFKLYDKLKISI